MHKNNLRCLPTSDIDSRTALELAKQRDLTDCVIVGWTEDGTMYMTSSSLNYKDTAWLLDCGKAWVMDAWVNQPDGEDT